MVNISNRSSTKLKPKIKLQERKEYRAGNSSTVSNQTLGKAVGDTISRDSEGTVNCQLPIPDGVTPTIHNCEILTVEYYLKVRKSNNNGFSELIYLLHLLFVLQVYLGVSFFRDPEMQLQLVVIPPTSACLYSAAAVGPPSYSDFPPPVPLSLCGYPAPAVSQDLNTRGFENQLPPTVTPPGLPSSGGRQTSTAPPLFQEEEPPSYQSLWPPYNTHDYAGSNEK